MITLSYNTIGNKEDIGVYIYYRTSHNEWSWKSRRISQEELMSYSVNNPNPEEFYDVFKEYLRVMGYFGTYDYALWVAIFEPDNFKNLPYYLKEDAFNTFLLTIERSVKGKCEYFHREYPIINFKKLYEALNRKYIYGGNFDIQEVLVDGKITFRMK